MIIVSTTVGQIIENKGIKTNGIKKVIGCSADVQTAHLKWGLDKGKRLNVKKNYRRFELTKKCIKS